MCIFTYEYVTIHLITDNAEWRRSGNRCATLRRVSGPTSPMVGIKGQHEQRLGLDEEKESEKPVLEGEKEIVLGVEALFSV